MVKLFCVEIVAPDQRLYGAHPWVERYQRSLNVGDLPEFPAATAVLNPDEVADIDNVDSPLWFLPLRIDRQVGSCPAHSLPGDGYCFQVPVQYIDFLVTCRDDNGWMLVAQYLCFL